MSGTISPQGGLTRRSFLKTTAAVAGAAALTGSAGAMTALAAEEPVAEADGGMQLAGFGCCGFSCGNCLHEVYVRDGKVVKTEVWAASPTGDRPCLKGRGSILQRTYGTQKLQYPMRRVEGTERGAGEWERITWDEAWAEVKEKLGGIVEEYGPEAVFISNSGNGSQSVFGTQNCSLYTRLTNVMNFTSFATGFDDNFAAGLMMVVGGPIFLGPGVKAGATTDCLISIGRNQGPAFTYAYKNFSANFMNGVPIIVVDPVYTLAASHADLWVNLRPGSDPAFLMGVINQVFAQGLENIDFLTNRTVAPILVRRDNGRFLRMSDVEGTERPPEDDMGHVGGCYFLMDTPGRRPRAPKSPDATVVWDPVANAPAPLGSVAPAIEGTYEVNGIVCDTALTLLKQRVAEFTPEKVLELCDITEETLLKFVSYATMPGANFENGYGANWYRNSVQSGKAYGTLLAVLGKVGDPAMPLGAPLNEGFYTANGEFPFKMMMPQGALRHILATGKLNGRDFPLKALVIAGQGGFIQGVGTNDTVANVLPHFEFILGIDIMYGDVVRYCDLILPAASNYEKWDVFPLMGYFKYVDQCIEPLCEVKTDYEIICKIAELLGKGEYFNKTREEFIAELFDNDILRMYGVNLDSMRAMHQMFAMGFGPASEYDTHTGRIEFYQDFPYPKYNYGQEYDFDKEHMVYWETPVEAWPGSEAMQKYPFILISTRGYQIYHTQFFDAEWAIETEPEPTVRINPRDAETLGIAEGMYVECYNDRGNAVAKAVLSEAVRPGMLVYPKGWDSSKHKAGLWSGLTRPEYTPMACDGLIYDCCVSIRPWKEA